MSIKTLSALSLGAVTAAAAAQNATVIYSEIPGVPSGMVPAGADVPEGTAFDSFDRPFRSPDGTRWIISASTTLATGEDEIIIVGSGTTGMTVVREGTMFGSPTTGENVGLIESDLGITDDGSYVFATNTDGPTGSDEVVVVWDGTEWSAFVREGDPVPSVPTEAFGSTLNSASAVSLPGGTVASFRATGTVGDLPSDDDDWLFVGVTPVAQSNVTVPLGQAGGGTEPWDNFDTGDFRVSPDGAFTVVQGDLQGDTGSDDVLVVNGTVVLQEGSPIDGASLMTAVGLISEPYLLPDGAWAARGDDAEDRDWVVRNGEIIALRDEPITSGSAETWSDGPFSATFFFVVGNAVGDVVVGGTTSNPDANADAVLVLNGERVLARQGDAVDLDGDGTTDDLFINVFNNDDGILTDDGQLYFTATLVDGAGVDQGQAFMVLDTTSSVTCSADVDGSGDVGFDDLLAVLAAFGDCVDPCETGCTADINGDCSVTFDDLLALLAAFGPCP